jgi:16S rRNA (adenine1518-N6/adenine1519-N6)-dimethyltransferase
MQKPIASTARTREILRAYDLHAKKGYGQNFLTDVSVVARCAEAGTCSGAVIEIGPGIGSLTEQLAQRARHVTAYEVDERLRPVLAETLAPYDNVEIIFQDVLTADLAAKAAALAAEYGSVSVCANLPYYITTPVLFRLFALGSAIPKITVMVQKEVADRFSAPVSSPDYGALSVESQALYVVKKLFQVPRTCFSPAPNVDSTIVQFTRREKEEMGQDLPAFFELVQACFQQRRKTLYNNLREYYQDPGRANAVLEKAGIRPETRAQELDLASFRRLYQAQEESR